MIWIKARRTVEDDGQEAFLRKAQTITDPNEARECKRETSRGQSVAGLEHETGRHGQGQRNTRLPGGLSKWTQITNTPWSRAEHSVLEGKGVCEVQPHRISSHNDAVLPWVWDCSSVPTTMCNSRTGPYFTDDEQAGPRADSSTEFTHLLEQKRTESSSDLQAQARRWCERLWSLKGL